MHLNLRRLIPASFAAAFLLLPGASSAHAYSVDRIEGGTLYFKPDAAETSGASFQVKTPLTDIEVIGLLHQPPPATKPYALVAAKPCATCPEERGLFLVSPQGGKPNGYVYPGRIFDPKIGAVVLQSRAFYGKCLRSTPNDTLVFFQKEIVEKKRRRYSSSGVYVTEMSGNRLEEKLIEKGMPRIDDTLKRVHKKECFEIVGKNRNVLNKPLDLIIRHGLDSDESDDEDETPGDSQS